MNEHSVQFLKRLLSTPGPSGDEAAVANIWRQEAEAFADDVRADVRGSSFAILNGGEPRVLLAGHIDEIGLMISYIDDDGYLFFSGIGGWDPQVLVGQRVRLLGRQDEVIGVIGKKPIHLMESEDQEKASKMKDLWIDIGVSTRDEALEYVRVGDVGVLDAPLYELPHGRIASRSLDDRIGTFTVLEALRLLNQERPAATVAAVATSQEETSFAGAGTATFSFNPQVAIAVDVTFASDHPEADKKRTGEIKLGGGPVISRGSSCSPVVFKMLVDVAEAEGIPYTIEATPRWTGTDADAIHAVREGVAVGVIGIPCRYMHSPNETIELADVEQAATLIAAFVRTLNAETTFIP